MAAAAGRREGRQLRRSHSKPRRIRIPGERAGGDGALGEKSAGKRGEYRGGARPRERRRGEAGRRHERRERMRTRARVSSTWLLLRKLMERREGFAILAAGCGSEDCLPRGP